MEHTRDGVVGGPATLLIFVWEDVSVHDKVTFNAYGVGGLRVTHWNEGANDASSRLECMYDILFEDVMQGMTIQDEGSPVVRNFDPETEWKAYLAYEARLERKRLRAREARRLKK